MTNDQLADPLYLAAKLLELTGENPFKARAYDKAADTVAAAKDYLAERLHAGCAEALEGVGEATRQALLSIATTGSFPLLEQLRAQVPPGVVELSRVRGLGVKKLQQVWRELGIDSPEALVVAARDGRLAATKGFGAKSATSLASSAEYYLSQRYRYRLDQATTLAEHLLIWLRTVPGMLRAEATGLLRRAHPTLDRVALLTAGLSASALQLALAEAPVRLENIEADVDLELPCLTATTAEGRAVLLYTCPEASFAAAWLLTTNAAHAEALGITASGVLAADSDHTLRDEAAYYAREGMAYVEPELREGEVGDLPELVDARAGTLPALIALDDLRGVVHNHSTWSDGMNTLREMAYAARALGFEYLVISDHSQSAAYAGGLTVARVQAQHAEIDALNAELAPFVIFKGIESDILADGSLDYPDAVLASFDVVIASVHSGLNMDEPTATARFLRAITNPYTTILGHPTGRLLASREGYPIDHAAVIAACAAHGVAIEINADPHRLDLDWAWVRQATAAGVRISINPDAHSAVAIANLSYGVLQGRKGWLTATQTLNALSLGQFTDYLAARKSRLLR